MKQEIMRKIQASRDAGFTDEQIFPFLEKAYPEQVKASLDKGFSQSDILNFLGGEGIDDQTGAGWKERFSIGSASSDADKVARTRAFYGDSARQENDGRISFIHPKTGRRTYVNPSGMDWGDLADGARDIVSMVAGVPAAIAGTVGGGGVNLVTGALAGSAGGAAAGQGVDALAAYLARKTAEERGFTVPAKQTPEEALKEAAVETALGTAGGTVLGAAGRGLAKVANPMKREIVEAFREAGIPIPTVGAGTGSDFANKVENAAGSMLGGGSIGKARSKALLDLQGSLDDTASEIAGGAPTASSVEEVGLLAQRAGTDSKETFKNANRAFYDDFEREYGDLPASLENTRDAIVDMSLKLSPESGDALRGELAKLLKREFADMKSGALNLNTVKSARTRIGEKLSNPATADTGSVSQGQLRRIYGALSDDYQDAIPDAEGIQALTKHQAWETAQHKARQLLDRSLFGNRTAKQTGEALLSPEIATETVDALRSTLQPADFNALRGSLLRNAARPVASEGLEEGAASASRLAKVLNPNVRGGMSEATQKKLWGKKAKPLRAVSEALAKSAQNANTSRTAETQYWIDLIKKFGTLAVGGGVAGLPGAIGGVTAPWLFSKATTNPWLIRQLAKPQSRASKFVFDKAAPVAGREYARSLLDLLAEEEDEKKKK